MDDVVVWCCEAPTSMALAVSAPFWTAKATIVLSIEKLCHYGPISILIAVVGLRRDRGGDRG